MPLFSRRDLLRSAVLLPAAVVSGGCGTILHPERRGQPAGPLDWKIVALDAIGLFFFFVPGVIAFAVDFSNGTIYLPPQVYGRSDPRGRKRELVAVAVEEEPLSAGVIERVVSRESGREVKLTAGAYEAQPLEDLEGFWGAYEAAGVL